MAHKKLARLFDDLEIGPIVKGSVKDLDRAVGDIDGEIGRAEINASGEAFSLFGRAIPIRGTGEASVRTCPPDLILEGVGDLTPGPASPGTALVELELACAAAVNPTRRRYRGPRLELVPRGDADTRYRHLRSLPCEASVKEAITEMVARARLPHAIDLDAETPDTEIHSVSGHMRFNLNLDFEVGWRQAAPGLAALLGELGQAALIDFDLLVGAGFGLAMTEEFAVTVARGPGLTHEPGRVRAIIARKHERQLTFGARFAMVVDLHLGDPLELLLDRILERRGWRQVAAALAALDRIDPAVEAAAAGDWQALRPLIGAQAAALVGEILERTRALESESAMSVVRRIVEVATAFEELEPEVRGLWEVLLDGACIDRTAPIFEALEQIAAVGDDPESVTVAEFLESLLRLPGSRVKPVVYILELLTGIDLETIVIGGATVRDRLADATRDAAAALAFLERLNTLPEEVFAGLRDLLASTGAGAVISRILAVKGPEDLARLLGSAAGAAVETLIGDSLDAASAEDLQRVQSWAARLRRIVDAADVQRWIRDRLAALNGELGFSLAFELELLTRRSRVLDIELDPQTKLAAAVLSDLGKGDVGGAVDRLADGVSGDFLVHDCVFTSQRSRVATLQALLFILGWRTDTSRRVTEDWSRLRHSPPDASRRARFSGGLVRRITGGGRRSEGALWLTHRVEGAGLAMNGPFGPEIDSDLRLSFSTREDEATGAGLRAVDAILVDLGFIETGGRYLVRASPGTTVSLALSLHLGAGAIEAFLTDLDDLPSWCIDARNALHRWFVDPAHDVGLPGHSDIRRGDALAAFVRSAVYASACSKSSLRFETEMANAALRVAVEDREGNARTTALRPVRQASGAPTPGPAFAAPITAVQGLLKDARRAFAELAAAHRQIHSGGEITADELGRVSALFCKAAAEADNRHWPSPTLPLWLVIARLARTGPQALAEARGVATVRIREAGATEWEIIERLLTFDGVPRHRVGDRGGIFPIDSN